MDFSTAARSPVVRLTRGQRQSMPVSNGHRLKPSKLNSHSFAFFQGHPKIIPPLKLHGKMDFSTAARSPVVRLTRGQRQSMPVSNGHRLKPSKLHSHSFAFFQGHPKIIPHAITWKNGFFHRCSVTRRPIDPRSTPIHARQ
jgi:hypothetical protein